VFSTHGGPELPFLPYSRRLADELERKGFEIVGAFSSLGYDTWLPLRLIGGLNRGRPDEADLARARSFAATLRVPDRDAN
jgi:hypothetical protein